MDTPKETQPTPAITEPAAQKKLGFTDLLKALVAGKEAQEAAAAEKLAKDEKRGFTALVGALVNKNNIDNGIS